MKMPSSKTVSLVVRTVVGLLLLAGAFGLTAWLIKTKPEVSKTQFESQSVRVQVMRVEPVEVARQWRGYGRTQAVHSADVPALVGASVVSIPDGIDVGRVVTQGQVIAELDKTNFRNALAGAQSRISEVTSVIAQLAIEQENLEERLAIEQQNAELAQREYQRQIERLAIGSATQTDVERATTTSNNTRLAVQATRQQLNAFPTRLSALEDQQAAAQAERDTAQANLERATITSPIDGVIEALDIEVGEALSPNMRVARIVNPQLLEVVLQLPASARSYITSGSDNDNNTVTLTTRSHPDDCPPWVTSVYDFSVEDSVTRTFTVYARVDQTHIPMRNFAEGGGPYKLPVGAFTLARMDTTEPSQHIIIPARAIQEGRIRTVVNGAIVSRSVEVMFDIEGTFDRFNLPDTQWVVLKEALEPGELVVLNASITILDGQMVEPIISNDEPDIGGATGTTQAAQDTALGETEPGLTGGGTR